MLKNKTILVTGGTGSFGSAFVKKVLNDYNPKKVIIYSRDEMKQWHLSQQYKNEDRIRFFIGDVRDKDRLHRAFHNIDVVVHAAALKIVDTAEYNPFEFVKTNIFGAMNIIDAAIDQKVQNVVALSTDKASNPINLYGASKLASDKLFISGNSYTGDANTKFSIVRYGNVMGSRGSVIPLFIKQSKSGELTVTDDKMTRFMISIEDAIEFVVNSLNIMVGGEIFVKKTPSMKVIDIAKTIAPKANIKIIGKRPGEKMHEQMIGSEDANHTYEMSDSFAILPETEDIAKFNKLIKNANKVKKDFSYESSTNDIFMTNEELSDWINKNIDFLSNN
ncbi:UDP-N-acetylglucosamine 4,6-dehydratase (inverting) [Pelagibacteraceae bacterium]|nr:UDP-N-acetylglucosamine 4,6-dehydratase (inverting) [Pelagibacteraceae bacterium]